MKLQVTMSNTAGVLAARTVEDNNQDVAQAKATTALKDIIAEAGYVTAGDTFTVEEVD